MADKTPTFTHQDWDIIGTAMGYRVTALDEKAARGTKGAARQLAQAEATARKVDAMYLETYPAEPAKVVDDGAEQHG